MSALTNSRRIFVFIMGSWLLVAAIVEVIL